MEGELVKNVLYILVFLLFCQCLFLVSRREIAKKRNIDQMDTEFIAWWFRENRPRWQFSLIERQSEISWQSIDILSRIPITQQSCLYQQFYSLLSFSL